MIAVYQIMTVVIFMFASAYIDYEHLKDGCYIKNHRSRFIQRSIFVISIGMLQWQDVLGCAFIFASTFDLTLNYLRFKKFTVKLGDTALWDLFWRKKMILYKILLPVSFILGIYLITLK